MACARTVSEEDRMISVVVIVGIVMVVFAATIAVKRTSERDERRRPAEMMKIAREKWGAETDLDALSCFYDFTVRRMYRLKHTHRSFDDLVDDANLILELRNSIMENDVIREIDESDGEDASNLRTTTSPGGKPTARSFRIVSANCPKRTTRRMKHPRSPGLTIPRTAPTPTSDRPGRK